MSDDIVKYFQFRVVHNQYVMTWMGKKNLVARSIGSDTWSKWIPCLNRWGSYDNQARVWWDKNEKGKERLTMMPGSAIRLGTCEGCGMCPCEVYPEATDS